ncbi:hypothetical protein FRC07_013869, partial [Ceratobasidium sp. 392]
MRWVVLLAFAADVFATGVVPVGFGSLHHRRLKRGRRTIDGTCKPRPTKLPTSTSIVLLPTLPTLAPTSQPAAPAPATSTRSSTPTTAPAAPVTALLAKLLPLGLGGSTNSWTTAENYGSDYAYSLADTSNTLRPTRILGGSLQAVSTTPDGKQAIEVFFGQGSYAFMSGVPSGISFYAFGPTDLTKANELTFGYSIFFQDGF